MAKTFAFINTHPNLTLALLLAGVLLVVAWCQDPIDRYR